MQTLALLFLASLGSIAAVTHDDDVSMLQEVAVEGQRPMFKRIVQAVTNLQPFKRGGRSKGAEEEEDEESHEGEYQLLAVKTVELAAGKELQKAKDELAPIVGQWAVAQSRVQAAQRQLYELDQQQGEGKIAEEEARVERQISAASAAMREQKLALSDANEALELVKQQRATAQEQSDEATELVTTNRKKIDRKLTEEELTAQKEELSAWSEKLNKQAFKLHKMKENDVVGAKTAEIKKLYAEIDTMKKEMGHSTKQLKLSGKVSDWTKAQGMLQEEKKARIAARDLKRKKLAMMKLENQKRRQAKGEADAGKKKEEYEEWEAEIKKEEANVAAEEAEESA